MNRRQLLDIFSRGVKEAIESSPYSDNSNGLLFNNKDGLYRDILTNERYYHDNNIIDIQANTQRNDNEESYSKMEPRECNIIELQFVEYSPVVFSYLRSLSRVENKDYVSELSGVRVVFPHS